MRMVIARHITKLPFWWEAMAENLALPIGITTYRSRSNPWLAERLVNLYAEAAPPEAKARTPVVLLPTPGPGLLGAAGTGPIRGMIEFLSVLYVVSGDTLYSVDAGGTATSLGTISGVGYVTMATNTTQLCIVARPSAWIYTPATTTLTQITDGDFPGSGGVTQIGGYFVHMVPDNSGEFFISDLDDGLAFDALDFATAETDSDPLMRPVADHQQLLLFGKKTVEIWDNTGDAAFPFARSQTSAMEKGCLAAFSVAKCDNTLFFVANDKIVYRLEGYNPRRVSTHAVEKLISDTPDPSDIIALSHVENGHAFYVITSMSGGWTTAYDAATGLWHDRETYPNAYWAPATSAECYDMTLVGDSSNGNIYELTTGLYAENGGTIRREVITAPLHNDTARLSMSKLEALVETGVGLNTGQGSDPQVMMQFSDDGGATWSNEQWRTLGAVGNRRARVIWRRLGNFRNRIFKFVVSDPVKTSFLGAYGDIS